MTTSDEQLAPFLDGLSYRSIGPYRGGRSAACTGVAGKPMLYYFGAAGGGIWKTEDGGSNWSNISDGYFGGSIGAIAVAPSDPNTLYVGGGEVTVRGNVSHGYGVWKSIDAGQTWTSMGLEDTQTIPRIRVHPTNPDIVYVAALGHLYGPNQQRGVYKSEDGGQTWKRSLFVNDEAGAVDLILDPNNPRTLYASTWKIKRTPHSLESGGEGSGIWKSVDAGESWEEITRNDGLPQGTIGISGVAVSPLDSNRVWAIIEAEDGGVFRSENGGKTWRKTNSERSLRQRAWYYTRIYAGTENVDEVYVLNVGFHRSGDGGKTFSSISTPHGDHHDLWIAPEDSSRLLIADDGGAQVSFDRGENWSTYYNQPTAQFYRVTTDNHFPYRIYGAQQDNSTVRIAHRTGSGRITEADWEPTAGGESGHIAPDPLNPDIVYGGSYGGYLTRINHQTGERRNIHVWPDNPMGSGAGANRYRFQWNFPIFFSPHDPKTLYTAANVLFKTNDEGQSWEQISPDLTRNSTPRLGSSGGPITQDNTSVEYYCTIFAALESPHEAGVLWVGTDDGLIQISRDAGEAWTDVTPVDLPEWAQINSIEAHPTEPGGLYVAATRYKSDDFKPYLYKTTDYGETWTKITDGIDRKHFTRVIRADADREGLLYAGTEAGIYVSYNDGQRWMPLQLNLPVVPITDLAIKEKNLIVATQGRSFWILDDLHLLHQLSDSLLDSDMQVLTPIPSIRVRSTSSSRGSRSSSGRDYPSGVRLHLYLKEEVKDSEKIFIDFCDSSDNLIRRVSTKPDLEADEEKLRLSQGLNEVVWNSRYPSAKSFSGLVMWSGSVRGPRAIPGKYSAKVHLGDELVQTVEFEIQSDPRSKAAPEDLQAQLSFLLEIRDKLTEIHTAIATIRDVRDQTSALLDRLKNQDEEKYESLLTMGRTLNEKLMKVEETLYQTKNQSSQDPLNFPIRLNDKLSGVASVASVGDFAPTSQARSVRQELETQIDEQLAIFSKLLEQELPKLNQAVRESEVPAIFVD
ncbi:MAG: WD40/YVTN/BNR-like repeat-containing protein [Pirellulaceae bacterium]